MREVKMNEMIGQGLSYKNYKNALKKRFYNGVMMILLIIPFFRPDFISEMLSDSWVNTIFTIWRIAAFLFVFGKYVKDFLKKPTIDFGLIIICIYEALLLYSSVKNQEMIGERVVDIANFLGIYFIYIRYGKQYPKLFIKMNFYFFSLMIWINAILTVIFPHGLNHATDNSARVNFLGKDNTITLIFILTIVFCVLYHNIFPRGIGPFLTTAVIFVMQMYYESGSGVVATLLIILYLCFASERKFVNKLLNVNLLFVVYMILEVIIVFLNQISFMKPLFQILNKASTFTDRRYYWNTAIAQLLRCPIFGQGSGITYLWNNNYYSHNSFLDILLKGGIVGAVLWCIMILVIMNRLKLKENLRIKGFMVCCFFGFLLVGLMEGLEDRIAFNAFLALVPTLNMMEESDVLRNKLINAGIKVKTNVKVVVKHKDEKDKKKRKQKKIGVRKGR